MKRPFGSTLILFFDQSPSGGAGSEPEIFMSAARECELFSKHSVARSDNARLPPYWRSITRIATNDSGVTPSSYHRMSRPATRRLTLGKLLLRRTRKAHLSHDLQ